MRIYVSGKITGLEKEDYLSHFEKAETHLKRLGYSVINPAKVNSMLPDDTEYEEYMRMCETEMSLCEAIYMLDNWRDSPGANRELQYAFAHNMTVYFESMSRQCEDCKHYHKATNSDTYGCSKWKCEFKERDHGKEKETERATIMS